MSRRASLPGAEELFRRTSSTPAPSDQVEETPVQPVVPDNKSTNLQVAPAPVVQQTQAAPEAKKGPRHDEKITFYCTSEDLMGIERARLSLRADHGVAADRGRIVRAALTYILEDYEARGEDSILLRKLTR